MTDLAEIRQNLAHNEKGEKSRIFFLCKRELKIRPKEHYEQRQNIQRIMISLLQGREQF